MSKLIDRENLEKLAKALDYRAKANIRTSVAEETNRAKAAEVALQAAIDKKANSSHTHDDRYFTESEMNTKLSDLKSDLQAEIDADVLVETNRAKGVENSLQAAIDGKAPLGHAHDDRYLTEDEAVDLADDLRLEIETAIGIEEDRALAAEAGLQAAIDGKANASHGNHVPAKETANNARFLRNDNTWQTITPANIGAAATAHDHNDKYYTEVEIDAKVTTLNNAINGKAPSSHNHNDLYFTETEINNIVSDLQAEIDNDVLVETNRAKDAEAALQANIDKKANSSHTHDDRYFTETEMANTLANFEAAINEAFGELEDAYEAADIALQTAIDGKSPLGHSHDDRYFTETEVTNRLAEKSDVGHDHADLYYDKDEMDARFSNMGDAFNGMINSLSNKADKVHTHDDRYYTETEIDGKVEDIVDSIDTEVVRAKAAETALQANIDKKAASGHLHDDRYYTETEINTKLADVQANIDAAVAVETLRAKGAETTLQANIDKKADASHGNHVPATETANNAKFLRNDNTWATVTPGNIGAAPTSHSHDDKYYTETEIDAKVTTLNNSINGKADKSHGNHVPATETANNAKFLRNDNTWATVTPANIGAAASSHGTHVTYATATPLANGTAAIGTSGKVAREDHVHPLQETISGNAGSADVLSTPRNITIGNQTNAFDGSENITYTLSAMGASAEGHNHDGRYYTESEINTKVTNLQAEIDADVKVEADRAKAAENTLQANIDKKANASHGNHVPTTQTANNAVFLRNDNTWATVTPANIGASATGHTHDDRYYTETEIEAKITTINTAISTAKSDAQKYADTKIAALVDSAPDALNTLNELASAITDHQDVYDAYVTEIDAKLAQKSDKTHTHNYAGSSSAGGAATSANKVNSSLTVKLNGGATEGTNLFTFNGSAAKTINITPSGIGAANSSHGTHVTYGTATPKANGTAAVGTSGDVSRADHVHPLQTTVSGNAGSADKLSTARTLTIGNTGKTFDGTANVSWSLTEIGAAASGHTHNYAGSSSAGGAANSVANSFKVQLNGGTTEGTNQFTFNGSAAKSVNITPSSIGAAASSHGTHVSLATAVPLIASGTGAVGTSSKQAREDHVHPVQTTVSGNAGSATVLQTARNITIGNQTKSFDGSANIAFDLATIGAAPTSHNHTSLTGITSLAFKTDSSDAGSIAATIDGTNTYFDFKLSDDASASDMWRWVFTPSGGTTFNAMTLDPTSLTAAKLTVTGEVAATSFTENGTALSSKYAAKAHGTHVGDAYATATPKVASGSGAVGTSSKIAREDHVHPLQTTVSGNAGSADKWSSPRTLTIGNSGKSVDGTANVSWTLTEIGAMPLTVTTEVLDLNNSKTTGVYNLKASSYTNAPLSGNATLFVNFDVGTPYQLFMHDATFKLYYRSYNTTAATWNDWSSTLGNDISGKAATATKLATARTINGTNFDGSGNITTTSWGAARLIYIADNSTTNTGPAISVNGGGDVTLKLPTTIKAALTGNASTATALQNGRKINGTSFNGTEDITTANWGTSRNLQIGLTSKAVNGSAGVSWSLTEIGASPLQKSVVNRTVSSGTLTLSTDRYQTATLASGNTIALPSVSAFTEINLFVKDCAISTINLPDNCKWRVDPNLESGDSFMFTFFYTGQEWLAEVKIYS